VRATPLDEVVENPKQKFIDHLYMTLTLFVEEKNLSTLYNRLFWISGTWRSYTPKSNRLGFQTCHFLLWPSILRPATLAGLVLNSSTFPIPRLALAGAARIERIENGQLRDPYWTCIDPVPATFPVVHQHQCSLFPFLNSLSVTGERQPGIDSHFSSCQKRVAVTFGCAYLTS
jgi:hypothetical protein